MTDTTDLIIYLAGLLFGVLVLFLKDRFTASKEGKALIEGFSQNRGILIEVIRYQIGDDMAEALFNEIQTTINKLKVRTEAEVKTKIIEKVKEVKIKGKTVSDSQAERIANILLIQVTR